MGLAVKKDPRGARGSLIVEEVAQLLRGFLPC